MSVTAVPLRPIKAGTLVILWLGIAAVLLLAVGLAWAGTSDARASGDAFLAANGRKAGVVTTASGLQYQVLQAGTGPTPTDADVTLVDYRGTLTDGTEFDKGEKTPMPVAGVVPGFAEALKLMPKGAKHRIWIPASLGYGDRATGPIPAGSTLVFDVTMIDFIPEAVLRQLQMQQQMQMQGGAAPGGAPAPAPR